MNLLFNYNIFPYWLGINNGFVLFASIIGFIVTLFLYIIFGGAICPNSIENRILRTLIILFWPLFICLTICFCPFYMLYEFSKPAKQEEAELNEFIINNK